MDKLDGYWLPAHLRTKHLAGVNWHTYWLKGGEISPEAVEGAVAVSWPEFSVAQLEVLIKDLRAARNVDSSDLLQRWKSVLERAQELLTGRGGDIIPLLEAATGYSMEMILHAMGRGELVDPFEVEKALRFDPARSELRGWTAMPGLAGRVRFTATDPLTRFRAAAGGSRPFFRAADQVEMVLGFAAGNIPGSSLLMALLGGVANYAAPDGRLAPAMLIRNSRHEPIFAPWILSAIEAIDPELMSGLAVLLWDYDDPAIQQLVMSGAGLMIAAAGDDTIAALDKDRALYAPQLRFHHHGHKVSFAVVDQDYISSSSFPGDEGLRARIPFLAALDSFLWDQNGCLSARLHFVKGDAQAYGERLLAAMRNLAERIPRGNTPMRFVHRAFDRYSAIADADRLRVLSAYQDRFALVLDQRDWDEAEIQQAVNSCMGRTVLIRPVDRLEEIPAYLGKIPAGNLQSVSLVVAGAAVPALADGLAQKGVTSIRSLGRAAFPRLSHSWDGYLPRDLGSVRPPGYFTTIEFDDLYREIRDTAGLWQLD